LVVRRALIFIITLGTQNRRVHDDALFTKIGGAWVVVGKRQRISGQTLASNTLISLGAIVLAKFAGGPVGHRPAREAVLLITGAQRTLVGRALKVALSPLALTLAVTRVLLRTRICVIAGLAYVGLLVAAAI